MGYTQSPERLLLFIETTVTLRINDRVNGTLWITVVWATSYYKFIMLEKWRLWILGRSISYLDCMTVRISLRLAVYRQSLRLGDKPLRLTTSIFFFFKMNTCVHSSYVASSLTRGWICRLQLLLTLASAVILRSESRETHDHILLSQIRNSPNQEGQVPVFISPRNRVSRLYPQSLGSLFVPSYDSQGYGGSIRPRLYYICRWIVCCMCCLRTRYSEL
jgi:hypothetical protein